MGLVHLSIEGKPGDYLLLEYLGGDKLYLPVYRLNLVGRYIGSGDASPALDWLGGPRWGQVQKKVDAAIEKVTAAEKRAKEGTERDDKLDRVLRILNRIPFLKEKK